VACGLFFHKALWSASGVVGQRKNDTKSVVFEHVVKVVIALARMLKKQCWWFPAAAPVQS
jgi:hypothetical protein